MNKTNKERLTNRTAFASTLENNLFDKLSELSKQTNIPKTKLFDQAITLLLNKYNDKIIVFTREDRGLPKSKKGRFGSNNERNKCR